MVNEMTYATKVKTPATPPSPVNDQNPSQERAPPVQSNKQSALKKTNQSGKQFKVHAVPKSTISRPAQRALQQAYFEGSLKDIKTKFFFRKNTVDFYFSNYEERHYQLVNVLKPFFMISTFMILLCLIQSPYVLLVS